MSLNDRQFEQLPKAKVCSHHIVDKNTEPSACVHSALPIPTHFYNHFIHLFMFFTKLLVKRSIKSLLFVSTKRFHLGSTMANSRFDYVRSFETNDELLPNCWIVVRIDGRNFHKFTKTYNYTKPNDNRGILLKKPIFIFSLMIFSSFCQDLN